MALNPLDAPQARQHRQAAARRAKCGWRPMASCWSRAPACFPVISTIPQTTAEVLRDGWLHTGDLAHIDADGYLFITGRKKELIVSSTGKKIYPSRVESLFKMEPLISQVLLIGDRLPYLTALFTINPGAAETLKGMEEWRGRPPSRSPGARRCWRRSTRP